MTTTIPGYLDRGNLYEEEFDRESPRVIIKNEMIFLKYCKTCKITRSVRSFHCSICNRCIERHDHHCGFVGNCIGKNNTNKFCLFLLSICIHSLLACLFVFIRFVEVSWVIPPKDWKTNDFFGMVIIIYSSIFFSAILLFLLFHVYLILTNQTTNEFIRGRQNNKMFDEGCKNNWNEVC